MRFAAFLDKGQKKKNEGEKKKNKTKLSAPGPSCPVCLTVQTSKDALVHQAAIVCTGASRPQWRGKTLGTFPRIEITWKLGRSTGEGEHAR